MEVPFQSPPDPFLLGGWRVEPSRHLLERDGEQRSLEPKQMHLLLTLAEEPGAVRTRTELLDAVWPDTVVTDHSLTRTISELRQALRGQDDPSRYIETIPKRGYRLAAPVRSLARLSSHGSDGATGAREGSWPDTVEMQVARASDDSSPPERDTKRSYADHSERQATNRGTLRLWVTGGIFFIAALAVVVINERQTSAPVPPSTALQATPVTSLSGREFSPALSPDGRYVAFVHISSQDEAGADLYVKSVEGEALLRLTDSPNRDIWPRWRPDGQYVLFQRFSASDCTLMEVALLGGPARRVGRCTPWMGWETVPAEDGYVVSEAHGSGVGLALIRWENEARTWLTQPEGLADRFPAVSPDGTKIAFARGREGGLLDLYVLDLTTRQERRLTHDQAALAGLSWSADGEALIAARGPVGAYQLWRIPIHGKPAEWIGAAGTYDPGSPSNEVDGRFVYADWRFDYDLRALAISTSSSSEGDAAAPRERTSSETGAWIRRITSTRWDYSPQLSPGGTRLAFVSDRSGSPELWVARRDQDVPVRISETGALSMGMPSWAPDGRWLVSTVQTPKGVGIYRFDAEGGPGQRLVGGPGLSLAPSVSRDGNSVYYGHLTEDGWQILRIPSEGGDAQPVPGARGVVAREGSEGQWLYFARRAETGLWRVPVAGGTPQRVVDDAGGRRWGDWTIHGEDIYYFAETSEGTVLRHYDIGSGAASTLYRHDAGMLSTHPGLSVTSSGDILFSSADQAESSLYLVAPWSVEETRRASRTRSGG